MKLPLVNLEDVLSLCDSGEWGEDPDGRESIPVIRVADVKPGNRISYETAPLRNVPAKKLAQKTLRNGDILVVKSSGSGNSVVSGRVAQVSDVKNGEYGFANFLLRLRTDPKKYNHRFLIHVLGSPQVRKQVLQIVGTTTYPNLSVPAYRRVTIPNPPLTEQDRIAKLLDEADGLRKLRAQADRRTEALIPALFHEMFGDPITNPKNWELSLFAEVGKLDRGRSKNRPRDEASLYGGKYPFIQTGDVANANGVITEYRQTYSEKGLAQSRLWPAGTLVITIAANIGKTAVLSFPACFPDSLVGFVPGEKVVVDYVRQWLVTMERRLEESAPQMAQKNINLKILSELTILVPPLPLQKEFAKRVTEIRAMEAMQAASGTRLEALFQSTLHRAFQGEL